MLGGREETGAGAFAEAGRCAERVLDVRGLSSLVDPAGAASGDPEPIASVLRLLLLAGVNSTQNVTFVRGITALDGEVQLQLKHEIEQTMARLPRSDGTPIPGSPSTLVGRHTPLSPAPRAATNSASDEEVWQQPLAPGACALAHPLALLARCVRSGGRWPRPKTTCTRR